MLKQMKTIYIYDLYCVEQNVKPYLSNTERPQLSASYVTVNSKLQIVKVDWSQLTTDFWPRLNICAKQLL